MENWNKRMINEIIETKRRTVLPVIKVREHTKMKKLTWEQRLTQIIENVPQKYKARKVINFVRKLLKETKL
jgi:hypothetical protein